MEVPTERKLLTTPKPPEKEPPPMMISDRVAGLRTDEEVRRFVNNSTRKDEVAVIEFGASWCHHCQQVFPHFYAFSKQYPSLRFAVAHIDTLSEEGKHLQRTPTFSFYKNGQRVDEMYGTNMEAMADRLWLHQNSKSRRELGVKQDG